MTAINIIFKTNQTIDDNSFILSIGDNQIDYTVDNSTLIINTDITFGVHTLLISPTASVNLLTDIRFTDVIIDQVSLRQCLYLSYCMRGDARENTTTLNSYYPSWHLPFGNPVSWWLAETSKYISNLMYGTNLAEKLEIFYPESITLDDHFPPTIKDFFKYNLGFYAYNKQLKTARLPGPEIPFVKLKLEYNEEALFQELLANIDVLADSSYTPSQHKLTKLDTTVKPWQIHRAAFLGETTIDEAKFPEYCKLIKSIEGMNINIKISFLMALHPGSYIDPHIDDWHRRVPELSHLTDCCGIFIPIGWRPGNYFKFNEIGLIPYDQGALLFNPSTFMHASANQSDRVRFTISIGCEFTDDTVVEYT
jgi:hypothetical protein